MLKLKAECEGKALADRLGEGWTARILESHKAWYYEATYGDLIKVFPNYEKYWCQLSGIGEDPIMCLHQDPKQALKLAVLQYENDLEVINETHGIRVKQCKESINE